MISFFANLFGYVLNFLYEVFKNYGLAIILFSVLVKVIMLPLTMKQQKTVKKQSKVQEEMKQIQFKYKNDQEKMNQEIMALYKREDMSPFSGCLSSIIQIVLLFAVFYLVRSPLTYMKKIDAETISKMKNIVQEQGGTASTNYPEIAIIGYAKNLESKAPVEDNENAEKELESTSTENLETNVTEENEKEKENIAEESENIFEKYKDKINVNMNFLGVDLSRVPKDNLKDWKTLIIPVLYVLSSVISLKFTTNTSSNSSKKKITDGQNNENSEETYDAMADTSKMMSWFMPIMSISIACVAPLGLALYWLMNNVMMIVEKIVLDNILKDDEKEEAIKNV